MFDRLTDGLLKVIQPRWLFRARRKAPGVRRGPVTHVIILDGTMSLSLIHISEPTRPY